MSLVRWTIVSLVLCGCAGLAGDIPKSGNDDDAAGGAAAGSGGNGNTAGGPATGGAAGSAGSSGAGGAGASGGRGGTTGGSGSGAGGTGGSNTGGSVGAGGNSAGAGGATGGSTGTGGAATGGSGGAPDAGSIVDAGGKGGTGGTGPVCDAQSGTATPVPDAPAQCTSGKKWTSGNGPTMQPGEMCQGCHGFSIAGTLYPTIHETGLCNGVNGGAQVVITPNCGTPITLTVNSAGNFYYMGTVRLPFTAKVVVNGVERAMVTPQTLGDCNACHTTNGLQGAPGRIIVP